MLRRVGCVLGALLLLLACGGKAEIVSPKETALEDGLAARVGPELIELSVIEEISKRQSIDPRVARDRAIVDALFAAHARETLAGTGYVKTAERSVYARLVLAAFEADALKEGEPSDEEVAEVTALHWFDLDRPAARRTYHSVVLLKPGVDPTAAEQLAKKIRQAVEGAKVIEEFEKAANAVPRGDLEVTSQKVPAVTLDGRFADPDNPPIPGAPAQEIDPVYAEATHAIEEEGQKSDVVRSKFGFHVIMLVTKFEETRVPLERRRKLLKKEILARRAQQAVEDLVKTETSRHSVMIARNAGTLTEMLTRPVAEDGP